MTAYECGRYRQDPQNPSLAVADILILDFQLAELGLPLEGKTIEIDVFGKHHTLEVLEVIRQEKRKPETSFEEGVLFQAKVRPLNAAP